MSRPTRYPRVMQISLSHEMADAVERIAEAEMIPISDLGRRVIATWLTHIGALKPINQANGHSHHAEARDGRV